MLAIFVLLQILLLLFYIITFYHDSKCYSSAGPILLCIHSKFILVSNFYPFWGKKLLWLEIMLYWPTFLSHWFRVILIVEPWSLHYSDCGSEVTDLTLVHGHVVFVRVAFADGSHAVHAGGYDDGGHLGEWHEGCRRGCGTLGKTHRGSGFGNGSLGKREVGHQIHLTTLKKKVEYFTSNLEVYLQNYTNGFNQTE